VLGWRTRPGRLADEWAALLPLVGHTLVRGRPAGRAAPLGGADGAAGPAAAPGARRPGPAGSPTTTATVLTGVLGFGELSLGRRCRPPRRWRAYLQGDVTGRPERGRPDQQLRPVRPRFAPAGKIARVATSGQGRPSGSRPGAAVRLELPAPDVGRRSQGGGPATSDNVPRHPGWAVLGRVRQPAAWCRVVARPTVPGPAVQAHGRPQAGRTRWASLSRRFGHAAILPAGAKRRCEQASWLVRSAPVLGGPRYLLEVPASGEAGGTFWPGSARRSPGRPSGRAVVVGDPAGTRWRRAPGAAAGPALHLRRPAGRLDRGWAASAPGCGRPAAAGRPTRPASRPAGSSSPAPSRPGRAGGSRPPGPCRRPAGEAQGGSPSRGGDSGSRCPPPGQSPTRPGTRAMAAVPSAGPVRPPRGQGACQPPKQRQPAPAVRRAAGQQPMEQSKRRPRRVVGVHSLPSLTHRRPPRRRDRG